jgi:hypothetical protein
MYAQAACDMETTSEKNSDASDDTEAKKTDGEEVSVAGASSEPGSMNEVWESHRHSCSQKRKAPSSSSSSSEEDEGEPASKRPKLDQSLIPIDQRKKLFFIQPGSRNYQCFFKQCSQHKQTSE